MPINEYMSPNINQHQNTHVDTYEPINFQFLNGQLEKKQAAYDAGELYSTTLLNNVKANALIKPHAEELQQRKKYYQDRTDQIMQEAGGNYATATPKLQQLGRELNEDLSQGTLAKINNTTNEYNTKKKAIEEWGIKHNKNVDQQLAHLNYQTFGIYAQDPEKYKNTLRAYDYGAPVDTNALIKEGLGFMKSSGKTTVDTSDPNWINTLKKEYSNPNLKTALQNYLITQPGIEYNVMLEDPTISDPSLITEDQKRAYVDKMILGPTQAATFSNVEEGKSQTGQGRRAGELRAENANISPASINQTIVIPGLNGTTIDEVKTKYDRINADTKATLMQTFANSGVGKISYVGPDGKTVILTAGAVSEDPNALDAIRKGNFTTYGADGNKKELSPGLRNTFVANISKQLNSNESVTNDIKTSVNEGLDELGITDGITIPDASNSYESPDRFPHDRGGFISKENLQQLALQKYTGKRQSNSLYFNDDGKLVKNVNGKEIRVGNSDQINKLFNNNMFTHGGLGTSEVVKKADEKLANKTEKRVPIQFTTVPESSTGADLTPYYNSIDRIIRDHSQQLQFKDPLDPTNTTDLSRDDAVKQLIPEDQRDKIESITPTPSNIDKKQSTILHANKPVNGMSLSTVNFDVKLTDGTTKTVSINIDKNSNLNSTALNSQNSDPYVITDNYIKSLNSVTKIPLPLPGGGQTTITIDPSIGGGMVIATQADGTTINTPTKEFFSDPRKLKSLLKYIKTTNR